MNKVHHCQLIGTGTAGLCFIIALINKLTLAAETDKPKYQALLDSLIAIEGSHRSGGVLDSYQINANTDADEIVDCLIDGTPFGALRDQYLSQPEIRQPLIALPRMGELMLRPVASIINTLLGDKLLHNTTVNRIEIKQGIFESFDDNNRLIARSKKCCFVVVAGKN